MNILYILELNEGRDGVSATETVDIGGQYTRVFLVETDFPSYYASQILIATAATLDIPLMGDAFPTDVNSVVVQITAHARPDDMYRWEVVVRYDISGSLLLLHPTVRWGTVQYQKPFTKDIRTQFLYTDLVIGATTTNVSSGARPFSLADVGNSLVITGGTGFTIGSYTIVSVTGGVATLSGAAGTAASSGGQATLGPSKPLPAVTTSAEEPYDPPQMMDDPRSELTLSRYFFFDGAGSFGLATQDQFKNAVNATAITIEGVSCAARTLKVMNVERELVYRNSIKYWHVTLRIQRDPKTWDFSILDQGYKVIRKNQIDVPIFPSAHATGKPVLLDGNGGQLAKGGTPVYRNFQGYNIQDFSTLNLTY